IVNNHALDMVSKTIKMIEDDTKGFLKLTKGSPSTEHVLETNKKMKEMLRELTDLKTKHSGRIEIVEAEEKLKNIQKEITDLRSEEHTSELQSRFDLVCRLLLEKKKK